MHLWPFGPFFGPCRHLLFLWHRRLGYPWFDKLKKPLPWLYLKLWVPRCQLGKHHHSIYSSQDEIPSLAPLTSIIVMSMAPPIVFSSQANSTTLSSLMNSLLWARSTTWLLPSHHHDHLRHHRGHNPLFDEAHDPLRWQCSWTFLWITLSFFVLIMELSIKAFSHIHPRRIFSWTETSLVPWHYSYTSQWDDYPSLPMVWCSHNSHIYLESPFLPSTCWDNSLSLPFTWFPNLLLSSFDFFLYYLHLGPLTLSFLSDSLCSQRGPC